MRIPFYECSTLNVALYFKTEGVQVNTKNQVTYFTSLYFLPRNLQLIIITTFVYHRYWQQAFSIVINTFRQNFLFLSNDLYFKTEGVQVNTKNHVTYFTSPYFLSRNLQLIIFTTLVCHRNWQQAFSMSSINSDKIIYFCHKSSTINSLGKFLSFST